MIHNRNRPKLLFVCSRNKWRSLTAEHLLRPYPQYEVRSAGTEPQARVKVNEGHIRWADVIFVMETKHLRRLRAMFGSQLHDKHVIVLDIPDLYPYMDEDLIWLLQSALAAHIPVPAEWEQCDGRGVARTEGRQGDG